MKYLKYQKLLDITAWYPTTISTGIAVLRYNLAVAYAIRGELDKSGETLKQASTFFKDKDLTNSFTSYDMG